MNSLTESLSEQPERNRAERRRASMDEITREAGICELLASPLLQTLEYVQEFPRPRAEVFRFFEDAFNLNAITPAMLRFRILTARPIEMRAGARIEYALRVRGIPIRWLTRIEVYDEPRRFVDRQQRGPYRLWWHEHEFEEIEGGTRMTDRVRYITPLAGRWAGRLLHDHWIRPDLERIFAYRRDTLAAMLGTMAGESV